ncbi:MAG: hypothetical protein U9O78_01570 [Patescibacteria group bacterium]|nr:hypothetical protein [Patescibacteria group bacterium]
MSVEQKPKVLIIEDDPSSSQLLLRIVEYIAPAIIINNLRDTLKYLDQMAEEGSAVGLVLLDANLSNSRDGSDGKRIMQKINDLGLGLTVLNTSCGDVTIEGTKHIDKSDVVGIQEAVRKVLRGE